MRKLLLLSLVASVLAQEDEFNGEMRIRAMSDRKNRHGDRALKASSKGTAPDDGEHNNSGGNGGVPAPVPAAPSLEPKPAPTGESCQNTVASAIANVEGAMVLSPSRCCNHEGPIAVVVTHALWDQRTSTKFEPFWNTYYKLLDEYTKGFGTCFVMTGFNQTTAKQIGKTLGDVLVQVNALAALLPSVPVIMSTDPTSDNKLVNLFRVITNTPGGPSIGVFNTGFAKVSQESVVTGQDRLPFVGYVDDDEYGTEAASITLQLLDGVEPVPLCFNGRPDLTFVGRRCASYYNELVDENLPSRYFGVTCRADSSVDALLALFVEDEVNAVFSHVDCCRPVAQAALRAEDEYNQTIVVGCQDDNDLAPPDSVDFVTTQPLELQAFQVASWVSLPVEEANEDTGSGRKDELFPSLQSLLNTAIYNVVMF